MTCRAFMMIMLSCIPNLSYSFQTKGYTYNLLRGSVRFPEAIGHIPMIRVHCMGIKIPYTSCEKNYTSHEFSYNIPMPAHQRTFHILITEKVHYETIGIEKNSQQANTIKYLKLATNQPYKLFNCALVSHDEKLRWDIQEIEINSQTRQIPDDTIIISYNPAYVQELKSVNTFCLPTIIIKSNVLDLCGSLDKFNEETIRATLASIDLDSFHKSIEHKVQHIGNKNIIAQTT